VGGSPPDGTPSDRGAVLVTSTSRLGSALTLLALLVAGFGMKPYLEPGPWQHSWLGHNGARYAQIARNYVRHGPLHHGGAPLLDAAGTPESEPDVYAHHPPGVSLLLAGLFAMAGEGETIARALPTLSTLLALLFLSWLVAGETDRLTGALAALVAASMPMTMAYGAHVDPQGPPVLAASLAVLLAYRRWLGGGSLVPWVALAALASSLDWWGLYAPAGCAVHLLLTRPRRWQAAIGLGSVTAALFFGWLGWLSNLPGLSLDRIFGAAEVRGPNLLLQGGEKFSAGLSLWFQHSLNLMPGWPLIVLLGAVLLFGGLGTRRADSGQERGLLGMRGLLALLLLPPLVHGMLFPAGMLVHSYWLFGLPIGLGAVVALALRSQSRRLSLGIVGLLLVLGWTGRQGVLPDEATTVPALLGQLLATNIPEGELVLTNYDANLLDVDGEGLDYLTRRPEVAYYSDRPLRGLVLEPGASDVEAWREARRRCPEAVWFLAMPFPWEPSPELLAEVRAEASAEPILIFEEPAIRLFRLKASSPVPR